MRNRAAQAWGFTLVELLVSVTMMVLILSAAYMAFSGAVRLYRHSEQGADRYQDIRLALVRLERDIAGIPPSGWLLFEGADDHIRLLTIAVPMDVDSPAVPRLEYVTWRLVRERGARTFSLTREEAPLEAPPDLPGAEVEPGELAKIDPARLALRLQAGKTHAFPLAGGIRSLAFRYEWMRGDKTHPAPDMNLSRLVRADTFPPGGPAPNRVVVSVVVDDPLSPGMPLPFTLYIPVPNALTPAEQGIPGKEKTP